MLQIAKRISFSLIIILLSTVHISLNKNRGYANDVGISIDKFLPFYEAFVLPYLFWFLYMVSGIIFLAIYDSKLYFKLVACISIGMSICFVVFYFFPTTVPRPEVIGGGVLNDLVRMVYSHDNPFNCFPSIHVLNTLLLTFFLCKFEKGGFGLKTYAVLSYVLITLSTFFIKQHYVLDAVAATLLAVIIYGISCIDFTKKATVGANPAVA